VPDVPTLWQLIDRRVEEREEGEVREGEQVNRRLRLPAMGRPWAQCAMDVQQAREGRAPAAAVPLPW